MRPSQRERVPLTRGEERWYRGGNLVRLAGGAFSFPAEVLVREKAMCYITRDRCELLVFKQDEFAGTQVPGGGLEPGETPEAGAAREALEETGFAELSSPVYLGTHDRLFVWDGERKDERRHFFWLEASCDAADAWTHVVTAGSWDQGMNFHCRFAPLEDPGLDFEMDALLPELRARLGLKPAPRSRPCVVAYLTRGRGEAAELLVLEGHPGGGLQVPAGGIDEGESLPAALGREVLEETGLAPSSSPVFLGSTDFLYEPLGLPPVLERRHYLWLEVPLGTPDVWSHRVTGGEADGGLLFTLRFAPPENLRLDWALDELIPTLKELL